MPDYFTTPFPFHRLIRREVPDQKLDLEASVRAHIRSLVLLRMGEFAYDRTLGFVMWDHDKQVFYHDREPYFEMKETRRGLLENAHARKHFKENLKALIRREELRFETTEVHFNFEKVAGNMSVYQRKIAIEVRGRMKSSGTVLSPPFKMRIMYTPFKVETNLD